MYVQFTVACHSGCAFTRFQTMRLKQAFPAVLGEQLVSYGPCQFPTLGFVVDRVSVQFSGEGPHHPGICIVHVCWCSFPLGYK